MYEELTQELRQKANLTELDHVAREYRKAADAIEELTKKQAVYLNNVETMSNLLSRFGTELDEIKATVSHLQDSQHYSGRYIKAIMGVSDEDNIDR